MGRLWNPAVQFRQDSSSASESSPARFSELVLAAPALTSDEQQTYLRALRVAVGRAAYVQPARDYGLPESLQQLGAAATRVVTASGSTVEDPWLR